MEGWEKMEILVVDDEKLALSNLSDVIMEVLPDCSVHGFCDPYEAVEFVKEHGVSVAFLDIEMFGMNGIELAKAVKDICPSANIIFVTGYTTYAYEAFTVRASGYLLKPARQEDLKRELEHLRYPVHSPSLKKLRIQTFGNFEVFYEDEPLDFGRAKTKEMFAYLVDRKGAGATTAELSAILWEDKAYTISLQKQFQTLVSDLFKTLRAVGAQDIIVKKRNFLSVNISKIDCDYYSFLNGDASAVNSYMGEYMTNYSWAEFTAGYLQKKIQL